MSKKPRDLGAGGHDGVPPGKTKGNRQSMACVGDVIMSRFAIWVMVAMVIGPIAITERSVAAEPLLEIDVNGIGDIRDVRVEGKEPVEPMPFGDVPIENMKLISTGSLDLIQVSDKGGTSAWCCWERGRWVSCRELMTYSMTMYPMGEAEKVDLQSEYSGGEEPSPIEASLMKGKKTHTIMVFEDELGDRYGMVISDDQTWYGPEKLRPTTK